MYVSQSQLVAVGVFRRDAFRARGVLARVAYGETMLACLGATRVTIGEISLLKSVSDALVLATVRVAGAVHVVDDGGYDTLDGLRYVLVVEFPFFRHGWC